MTDPRPGPWARRGHDAVLVTLAVSSSFLAAFLVFSLQPMTTRMVLPRLGGSAAVWNTALAFFQIGLLAGYLFTHITSTRLSPRTQAGVHLALIALATFLLPLDVPERFVPPTSGSPSFWLLGVLAVTVGLPYLALTAVSPLVQRWFSLSTHARRTDPYFLYAASNAGSFLGLLTYPFVVERRWSLDEQAGLWTAAYVVFACAAVALVALARPGREQARSVLATAPARAGAAARWRERARWTAFAFVPSSLMLGVTTHVTTDIASVPLFWVVPLAIYLATYVVAFGARRLPVEAAKYALLVAGGAVLAAFVATPGRAVDIALHLALLACAGFAFHVRLAAERPTASRLTEFFLCVAVGGALGGFFNALVAPLVFDRIVEYGLVLVVAMVATATLRRYRPATLAFDIAVAGAALVAVRLGPPPALLFVPVAAVGFLLLRRRPVAIGLTAWLLVLASFAEQSGGAILHDRNFYGAWLVREADDARGLVHGNTLHGLQLLDPRLALEPTTYYTRSGPIGQVFDEFGDEPILRDVAVIGLGVGTLAAYSRPGRSMTFFEIDPAIRDLANDPAYFTFLDDPPGRVEVVVGDGRVALERRTDRFGLVVVDAFSSDAIPVHLLTREGMQVYLDRLHAGGLVAFHVSNRYVDLEPVLAATAERAGMHAAVLVDGEVGSLGHAVRKSPSVWFVCSRSRDPIVRLLARPGWAAPRRDAGARVWTDDHADLVAALRF